MKNTKIYIILFIILYSFVALVSGIHGFAFFGLANTPVLAVMLAVAFEIGQAAVLFSILTDKRQQKKVMPWVLMVILTLVQVMGNVYNCYRYLILNAGENLKFFKEPIFIWTQLPDAQANVILSYIQGAILPIVALLLTSMVTGFLNRKDEPEEEIEYIEEEPEDEEPEEMILEDDKPEEIPEDEDYKEEEEVKEEHFDEKENSKDEIKEEQQIEDKSVESLNEAVKNGVLVGPSEENKEEVVEEPITESEKPSHFINL